MNQIFRLQNLLNINTEITVQSRQCIGSNMTLLTVDNVLQDYDKLYDIMSATPAADWKNTANSRNFIDYKEGRLRYPVIVSNQLLELAYESIKHYFNKETDLLFGSIEVNVFQQIAKRKNDFNIVHTDQTMEKQSFTCLMFLNQPNQCSGGTAFFEYKPTNQFESNSNVLGELLLEKPNLHHNGVDYWNNDTEGKVWQMIDYAEMVSNRLIIFPSNYFHTAYHPVDSFFDFSRLTLVFWMGEV